MAALAVYGCQVEDLKENTLETIPEVIPEAKVFTATIEDNTSPETRTSLDAEGNVLWKQYDQVSIFAGSTINEHYQVTDASDGQTAATLNKVEDPGFVAGTDIDNNVAFYPYASTASIAKSGGSYIISNIELPASQNYAAGSFGNGAFPMAAVTGSTGDMNLKFKNILGGLKLQLKGTATIASISLTGNNNEILYGDAEVTATHGSAPSISLTDASAKTVTLDCGAGVALDSETATPFIIALPPITMTGGFTVIVTDTEGKQMEIKTTKSQTINRSSLLKMPAVNYEGMIKIQNPLTLESTGETSISLIKVGSPDDISLEYRINNGDWTEYIIGSDIDLTNGTTVSFRSGIDGNTSFSKSYQDYYKFVMIGSGSVAASGTIMSLLGQNVDSTISISYCFCNLFRGCTCLTTAPELTATTLANNCYEGMFDGCKGLTSAPALPATTLANACYSFMFYGCTGLTSAPALPATTLAEYCYSDMFQSCTGLTSAPALPATTLAKYCYSFMFYDCTGLTAAPELPATMLAKGCYSTMFWNCASLTTAPTLAATTLAEGCYEDMFWGCTGLTSAPALPATTLADGCYYQMFYDCIGLTSAPELPATTLADGCYSGIFRGCIGLTSAPELPATTLADYCYGGMLMGCTGLTAAPELPAITLADGCYSSMFEGCTGLTSAPELPATTLADLCYCNMLVGCTGLTAAPELPATTLADYCYCNMFEGCTSLTAAPALPATTLANNCYSGMFRDCTSLTTAPVLPAETLVTECYLGMFYGCTSLNWVKMLATNINARDALLKWLYNVSSTGTFVKNASATWDVTGIDGIPSGWTVQTE